MERRMDLQGGEAEVAVKGGKNRKLPLVGGMRGRITIITVIIIGTSFLLPTTSV